LAPPFPITREKEKNPHVLICTQAHTIPIFTETKKAACGHRAFCDGKQTGGISVKRVVTAIVLMSAWLLMSGLYKPILISFGAASVLLVVWVMARMDKVDGDVLHWHIKPIVFMKYQVWLLGEIAKANWIVTCNILSPRLHLRQHMFAVPVSAESDIAQVTFANSITLTPGTITIETEPGHFTEPGRFLVHALDFSEADLEDLAEMDRRVVACETLGASAEVS